MDLLWLLWGFVNQKPLRKHHHPPPLHAIFLPCCVGSLSFPKWLREPRWPSQNILGRPGGSLTILSDTCPFQPFIVLIQSVLSLTVFANAIGHVVSAQNDQKVAEIETCSLPWDCDFYLWWQDPFCCSFLFLVIFTRIFTSGYTVATSPGCSRWISSALFLTDFLSVFILMVISEGRPSTALWKCLLLNHGGGGRRMFLGSLWHNWPG